MSESALTAAFEFAVKVHAKEKWKVGGRAFLHHPMAVASLVLFYGGSLTQAQAALLHDTLGSGITVEEIKKNFGNEVGDLVGAFEDPPEAKKPGIEWAQVRRAYLQKIESLPEEAVFVIACEELHELSCLNQDLKFLGSTVLGPGSQSYPVPGRDLGWYFKSLTSILYKKLTTNRYHSLVSEFAAQTKHLSNHVFEGM